MQALHDALLLALTVVLGLTGAQATGAQSSGWPPQQLSVRNESSSFIAAKLAV
jgi:hypothetical protein